MPANLTERDGKVLFVYNRKNGHPWHSLGEPFDRYMTLEEALQVTLSDDQVIPVTLYADTPNGQIEVEDTQGVWSNIHGLIATGMGMDYVPKQREDIARLAYEITGLSKGDAHIDTMGNLGPHANKFFVYIKVPELVIDPSGIADTIERGVTAATSFDQSLRNLIFYTDIRTLCENTLSMGIRGAERMISVKHTKNSEERILEAAKALEYIGVREKEIIERAEQMLKVDGDKALDRVFTHLWPVTGEEIDDKTKTRRTNTRTDIRWLYEGEGNFCVAYAGRTGWAAYNAVTEYLDHYRPLRGKTTDQSKRRASAAVFPGTTIYQQKAKIAELVLN